MRILLLLDGGCPRPDVVRRIASSCPLVLCADGGVRHAIRMGLRPRFVVGDMDSLPRRLPPWEGVTYLCDFDKDTSDFEKALRFAAQAEDPDVYVAGAFGGRADHVLVNLSLAERYSDSLRITLVDQGMTRLAGPGRHEILTAKGRTISVIACAPGAVLTTYGLHYALRRRLLKPGSGGLSNRAIARRVAIDVHRGKAWIVIP